MASALALLAGTACASAVESGAAGGQDAGDAACRATLESVGGLARTVSPGARDVFDVRLRDSCTGPIADARVEFSIVGNSLDVRLLATGSLTDRAGVAFSTLQAAALTGTVVLAAEAPDHDVQVRLSLTIRSSGDACANHCSNRVLDCGETGLDCGGGGCAACADPCAGHCTNGARDCGETGVDCGGGGCAVCFDPCRGHCSNQARDCGETGVDCGGGGCGACPDPCAGHCANGALDCGEGGVDCGGGGCGACSGTDEAAAAGHTLPQSMACGSTVTTTVTMTNTGSATWYRAGLDGYKLGYVGDNANEFLPAPQQTRAMMADGQTVRPGASVTFSVPLRAPSTAGNYPVRLQMVHELVRWFGAIATQPVSVTCGGGGGSGGCSFPQGLPDADYIASAASWSDTDRAVDDVVTEVMVELTGCSPGSNCPVGQGDNAHLVCQDWFARVNQRLRERGLCAGLHVEGHTDEIAVSSTGCRGRWYGYHICNYGGKSVVWMPGARRGWWQIAPRWCP